MKFQTAASTFLFALSLDASITSTSAFVISRTNSNCGVGNTALHMVSHAPELNGVTGLRRVVVTGLGITSCLGNTLEDVKESLHKAKSGIKFSQEYADLGIKSQVCGKPDLTDEDFTALIPKKCSPIHGHECQVRVHCHGTGHPGLGIEAK